MERIVDINQAIQVSKKLREQGKKIVIAGGCFDILHIGHVIFIEKAKKAGDVLMLFLESDEKIRHLKGKNRPINNQPDRARILTALAAVDYVVLLTPKFKDRDYDSLITKIMPNVIATSEGDKNIKHKERQGVKIKCPVVEVTSLVTDQSTSRLVRLLGTDL